MSKNKKLILSCIATGATCLVLFAAGCAPQPSGETNTRRGDESPADSVEFSMDAECDTCHATERESTENSACLASKHQDITTCTTCHADESSMTEAHQDASEDGKMPKKLKKTDVPSEACTSCHAENERIEATANSVVCTDSKGTVANPHDLADNEEHGKIACSDCHRVHSADSLEETAKKECLSCHHADVYECHTCHE